MDEHFAGRVARSLRAAALLGALLGCLLMVREAAAQQVLPRIDLFVYLDNSKTVFTGRPDSPSKRIAEMLSAVFRQRIDDGSRTFVTLGDRVSLMTFGNAVVPLAEGVDGGDAAALDAAIGRFNGAIQADKTTEFDKLLRAIAANPQLRNRSDGRLKIVLIASDFIHDTSNAAKTERGTGVCDVLSQFKKANKAPAAAELAALKAVVDDADAALPVFFGLLSIRPTDADFANSNTQYRDCVMETVRLAPLQQALERSLGAKTIEYGEATKDIAKFSQDFIAAVMRATQPHLVLERAACLPRGTDGNTCSFSARNAGRTDNVWSGITLHTQPGGPPVATLRFPEPVVVAPKTAQERAGTFTGLEARALQEASALFAAPDDQGRGPPKAVRVERTRVDPLTIEGASVGREAFDRPYLATLKVRNPSATPKSPVRLLYYTAREGGEVLAEQNLATAAKLDPGTVGDVEVLVPSRAVDRIGQPDLFVALVSREADGETERVTGRVALSRLKEERLQIVGADSRLNDDAGSAADLLMTVRNPLAPGKRIVRLEFRSTANGEPAVSLPLPDAPMIDAGGTKNSTIPLPDGVRSLLLSGTLYVAAVDSQTNTASEPMAVKLPAPLKMIVEPQGCAWKGSPSFPDDLTLSCSVKNSTVMRGSVAALVLSGDKGKSLELPLAAPRDLPAGGQAEVSVPVRRDALNARVGAQPIEVRLADSAGHLSEKVAKPGSKPGGRLYIRPGDAFYRSSNQGNDIDLILKVRNDGSSAVSLRQARIFEAARGASDAKVLPMRDGNQAVPAATFSVTELAIRLTETERNTINPHLEQKVMLYDEDADSNVPTAESFPVTPLPGKPLFIAGTPTWTGETTPQLTLTLANPAEYSQAVEKIRFAVDPGGPWDTYDVPNRPTLTSKTDADRAPAQGAVQQVHLPFNDAWQVKYLLGERIFVCVVTHGLAPDPSKPCNGETREVPVQGRARLKVELHPQRPFTTSRREVNLLVRNPGLLPNLPTTVSVVTPVGSKVLHTDPVVSKPVLGGREMEVSVPLSEQAFTDAYRLLNPLLRIADLAGQNSADIPLRMERFTFAADDMTVQHIPGRDSYLSVRTVIKVSKEAGLPLEKQQFNVALFGGDGTPLGPVIPVMVNFTGSKERFPVAWRFSPDDSRFKGGRIEVSQPDSPKSKTVLPIERDPVVDIQTFIWWAIGALSGGLLIGFSGLYRKVGEFLVWKREHSQKLNAIWKELNSLLAVLGLGTFGIMSFLFAVLSKMLSYGNWQVLFISAIFVALMLGVAVSFAFSGTLLAWIASRGTWAVELPRVLHRIHLGGRIVVVSFAIGIGTFVWHNPQYYEPYDPRNESCHWDFTAHTDQPPATLPACSGKVQS